MYQDAKEELKRLEEALLEEDPQPAQDDISQWDMEDALSDIPDLPVAEGGKDKGNFALAIVAICLAAGIAAVVIFWLIRYGGAFL